MSLMDVAMSRTSRAASGAPRCSTVSLTTDFVGPGKSRRHDRGPHPGYPPDPHHGLPVGRDRGRGSQTFDRQRAVEDPGRVMSAAAHPPPGYRETKLVDPFEIFVGPLFETGEGAGAPLSLLVDERHVNLRGSIHGGMLMTLADMTLGAAVWDATDLAPSVTMNMQTQFLKEARVGDQVEVRRRSPARPGRWSSPAPISPWLAKSSSRPRASGSCSARINAAPRPKARNRFLTMSCQSWRRHLVGARGGESARHARARPDGPAELVLGSVQLGLPYGAANRTGQPSRPAALQSGPPRRRCRHLHLRHRARLWRERGPSGRSARSPPRRPHRHQARPALRSARRCAARGGAPRGRCQHRPVAGGAEARPARLPLAPPRRAHDHRMAAPSGNA